MPRKLITAVFPNMAKAEKAIKELSSSGSRVREVFLITQFPKEQKKREEETDNRTLMMTSGIIGGILGLLIGVTIVFFGVGTIISGLPLTLLLIMVGVVTGALADQLLGLAKRVPPPEEKVRSYEKTLENSKRFIEIQAETTRPQEIERIFKKYKGKQIG